MKKVGKMERTKIWHLYNIEPAALSMQNIRSTGMKLKKNVKKGQEDIRRRRS